LFGDFQGLRQAFRLHRLQQIRQRIGIECRQRVLIVPGDENHQRRRHIAGPTGCGLCGIDSIAEAVRPAAIVTKGRSFSPRELMTATASLSPLQPINIETRAVHAAAFWTPSAGVVALREDVGRHNALDKLAGAIAQSKIDASEGMVVLTSRVSVEMVQKTAAMGTPVMVAVSAPTALAVGIAKAAGITLVAVSRSDGFEVFSHPDRINPAAIRQGTAHVA